MASPITLDYLKQNNIVKEYINCYLVLHDVRPACLIQFIDYGETSEINHNSNTILLLLKHHFPSLHHLKINQGMLISKLPLRESDVDTNTKLGETLGYLCSDTFDRIKESPQVYYYEYSLILNDADNTKVSLFSFMCPSNQLINARKIYTKIQGALKSLKDIIKNIIITPIIKLSIDYLIHKLYLLRLTDDEISDISDILANFGFDQLIKPDSDGYTIINFDNTIHKGIVISILTFIKTEIFETLLNINKTDKKLIDDKINLWETLIIDSINESEKPSAKSSAQKKHTNKKTHKASTNASKSSRTSTKKR